MYKRTYGIYLLPTILTLMMYMSNLYAHSNIAKKDQKDLIDISRIPIHIGVIMDGNGRWATRQGKERLFGHKNATRAVKDTIEGCAELGIRYLTVYAFSTENKNRPEEEVAGIMEIIAKQLEEEVENLVKNNIKIVIIGDIGELPSRFQKVITKVVAATKDNDGLQLTLALNYGGRSEIVAATKAIIADVQAGILNPKNIDDKTFGNYLYTQGIPDPALLIRTSGEMRLSGFLPWQSTYAELYFSNTLWPDFRKNELYKAIIDFQKRDRRFGKLNSQT